MDKFHPSAESARKALLKARFWPEGVQPLRVWKHDDGQRKVIKRLDNDRYVILDYQATVQNFSDTFAGIFR